MKKKVKTKRERATSIKPKKITVKFFINKAVQPAVDGKTKRYPLYVLITYDRKNTMMRCHYGHWYKDMKEVEKVHYPGLLALEERIIRKTIAYEMIQRGAEFDLKGTYKKYDLYARGIHVLLERDIKAQLLSVLSRMEPYAFAKALNFADPDVEFDTLYKISRKVYKDLNDKLPRNFGQAIEIYRAFMKVYQGSFFHYSFPVVIEWIDGSAVADYRSKLAVLYPDSPSMIKRSIGFIDAQVHQVLE